MNANLQFNLPFERSAINEERREVWGWGSTESLATDGRVITYEASKNAFDQWISRGNIREMHQPIAAGRALSWNGDDDSRRIWVGTRVSRGAESTWLKIMDGTLQSFSVRGRIDKMEPRTIQRNGKSVTVPHVLAYTIDELSYVDAPSDPGALFVDIIRGDGLVGAVLDEGELDGPPALEQNITMVSREVTADDDLHSVLVDPEELARAETVIITPIADDETPTGVERSQALSVEEGSEENAAAGAEVLREVAVAAASDGEQGASEGTTESTLVERLGGEGGDDTSTEVTQAALADQILRQINQLIAMEAGEIAEGGEEAVWDVYGLLQARNIIRGFMVQEVVEAVLMARKADELDTEVTTLQTQLAEAITRLDSLQASHEAVERGENPVIAELTEKITTMEAELTRLADEPMPTRPLARIPVEKLFPGDEPGKVDGPGLMRALETVIAEGPASMREETQMLAAKVALHEVYRQGPNPAASR